ncbi:MAG TPA: VWA domain-containing protein [Acidimicrobiales bacterium]|nr:VWA domain-containing protein [Acidimicrobiales bacterium]
MTTPERMAVAFAAVLRGTGLDVGVGRVVTFTEALAAVGLARRDGVYWAGRATLLARPEDVELYDRAFEAFWLGLPAPAVFDVDAATPRPVAVETSASAYSPHERLRHKDFSAYSHDEWSEARRLMAELRLSGSRRRSRRLAPGRRGRPDVRRTVRAALRTGGEVVARPRLAPSHRPRRVVLLCDVSGSMEPYARALARFLHVAVAGGSRVEAFALGTRLTRVTRELSSRDPDAALAAAAQAVADWSGGTRLGEGLQRFNDEWGVRGMARGAVVVVLSDGWDRGDPAVLVEQLRRLTRVAHRLVWVNPLKASPGYEPLARGMAAAMPFVDEFLDGHSLASLEALAEAVAR